MKIHFLGILLSEYALCLSLQTAHAEEAIPVTINDLEEKQQELALERQKIVSLDQNFGRFLIVRDHYLLGSEGMKERVGKWYSESSLWQRSWYELVAFTDKAGEVDSATLKSTVQDKLEDIRSKWQALKIGGLNIAVNCDLGLTQLSAVKPPEKPSLPRGAELIEYFQREVAATKASFENCQNRFRASHEEYHKLIDLAEGAVLAKIKKQMLNYPELKEVAAEIADFLAAEKKWGLAYGEAKQSYDDYLHDLSRSFIFAAETTLKSLKQQLSDLKLQLSQDPRPTPYLRKLEDSLDTLEKSATAAMAQARLVPSSIHIQRLMTTEGPLMAKQCRDEEKRKYVHCELFRQIFQIPASEIAIMSDPDLAYLENRISEIFAGPLSTNEKK